MLQFILVNIYELKYLYMCVVVIHLMIKSRQGTFGGECWRSTPRVSASCVILVPPIFGL
jgi:hypothetical protein